MADKKYKDHTMGKGKARVTTRNKEAHDALDRLGWGHAPFKMKGYSYAGESPMNKKNAAGKEQGADGKACWDGFRYAGTENGKDKCVPI